ncbi:hypothetical protein ABID21_000216 [Pseudorhizobium tarimense]|uniref:Lipoprotein n=1 Tax=Pseudorhizobium tarimense TaxID=1079109 RepID=A0ABV2H0Z1_9HYPH|nr:hypothetical protein [Pseudorhizobium tarimense]MCJ8517453.1 hypothetical protein [Pseudorhizobium tarimense]
MSLRTIASTAAFAVLLSACTTTSAPSNPIEARWVGQSAGAFFARYSPPMSDTPAGSTTLYNWRGGYQRIKLQNGRTANVSCAAQITVDEDYVIRKIRITADRQGAKGQSYCEELLTES